MTSPFDTLETSHAGLRDWLWDFEIEGDQTGSELGGVYAISYYHRGSGKTRVLLDANVFALGGDFVSGTDDLVSQAAALARETPQVESRAVPVPRLSGNLAEDVHSVCGLTWEQIASVFKVSERAAAGWRMQGVPAHRVQIMEALRAVGLIFVGGLGSDGVAAWLVVGEPSRLERLRDGEVEGVAAEARSYLDTPAT